jgi:urease accessory protein
MSLDPVTNTEGERADPNMPGTPEAPWGQAATPTDTAWLVGLLQAGDSFYPTGSYAHSFGLEGLVQSGVIHDAATLRVFLLNSVLPAMRQAELPLAAHAWQAFATCDWVMLAELSQLAAALKTPRELRLATNNIGRQRAEMLARLRPHPLAAEYLSRAAAGGWSFAAPISAALEGRVLGGPKTAVLAGIYYSSTASLLSAAMKILRMGQNSAQTLLTEALASAPGLIAAAEQVPWDEIGWFNPWLDIAAARHESADSRMFIS